MCEQFVEAGFMADADLDSSCLLNKKVRNAQLAQYNFILGMRSRISVKIVGMRDSSIKSYTQMTFSMFNAVAFPFSAVRQPI